VISYAQNAEDVVLARLFAGRAGGRYVDVGAGDPVEASVTKHFYDLGWRGVNVEPVPALADKLAAARPEDVTLPVAIGAKAGTVVLHVVAGEWGWSTLDDQLASTYRGSRGWTVRDVEVEMVTLAAVLDEHPGPIDFLKIDVEGAEQEVIEGADWARHRPRVVVVEATEPGTPTPSHQKWEPMLLDAGYRCVLFDGLNRFYAGADDDEAHSRLAAPANVFDSFERPGRKQAQVARAAEVAYVRRLEDALREARETRGNDAEYLQKLENTLADLRHSLAKAYRYTAALERRVAELEASQEVRPG
jgi:FkbM family methyltransferase